MADADDNLQDLKPSEKPFLKANPLVPPEYGEGHKPFPNLAAIIKADEEKRSK